jgi:hypothetical protein
MAWFLNPALTRFRDEVNARWPHRDKTSDGTIGDEAHQATSSDHNPDADGSVDAWDMDVDGVDVAACKRAFQAHEAAGYWIHNDRIAFRDEGWRPRSYAYAGPGRNRHDKHVHWNTRQSHERSTTPWFPQQQQEVPELIEDSKHGEAVMYRLEALVRGLDKVAGGPTKGEPVWVVTALRSLGLAVGQVDEAVIAGLTAQLVPAIVAAVTDAVDDVPADRIQTAVASAVRTVLGSLDEPTANA